MRCLNIRKWKLGGRRHVTSCHGARAVLVSLGSSSSGGWFHAEDRIQGFNLIENIESDTGHNMILQILSNMRVVDHGFDSQRLEQFGVSDARELQNAGRANSAPTNNHLFRSLNDLLCIVFCYVLDSFGNDVVRVSLVK